VTMRLRTQIIPIGDSLGVCLPQPAIERSGLSRDVELEVRRNEIVPSGGYRSPLRKAHEILANETPAAVDKAPDSKDPKTP